MVSKRGQPSRPSLVEPSSPTAEAFRTLRLALQFRAGDVSTAVVVTSAEPGAGKSTTAANLAVVSALARTTVLLVDADLRKPVQHEIFGIPRSPGLVDYLAEGGDDLGAYLHHGPGRLQVLPAGRAVARSSDVTATPRMAGLLKDATNLFDLVILDTPPVLAAADVEGIAAHSDVEVVVVVDRASHMRNVTKTLKRLELTNGKIAGLVLNRDGHQEAYGYG